MIYDYFTDHDLIPIRKPITGIFAHISQHKNVAEYARITGRIYIRIVLPTQTPDNKY